MMVEFAKRPEVTIDTMVCWIEKCCREGFVFLDLDDGWFLG